MKLLFKYLIGIVLLASGIWLGRCNWKSYQSKKETGNLIQHLQHLSFKSLPGNDVFIDGFNPQQATVIIYFHPECEHCQYEASEIGNKPEEFEKTNLIMITPDDSIPRIEAFALKYHLWKVDNLDILLDRTKQFKQYFGTAVVPSVFIYGANKKLIRMYKGEIQINVILGFIHSG